MKGPRARIIVEVNTDAIPGWGAHPQDFADLIQRKLDETVPHYEPKVYVDNDYSETRQQV